jgi:hypothetical protein
VIDHGDIVKQLHAEGPPAKTVDGALAFLLRVIARLQQDFPSERVGLLVKTAGENIVPYAGTFVSAGRIVYPDHDLLVKILTDIPTTNGPSWQTEQGIPNQGHHGGYLAVPAPGTPGTTLVPTPSPPPVDLAPLLARLTALEGRATQLEAMHAEVNKQLGTLNEQMKALAERPAPPVASHTHNVDVGPVTVVTGPPR